MPSKLVNMQIKEVSVVDKAANGHTFVIMKKAYSEEEIKAMAASGEANPDGSFPIKTAQDVANAVKDWGRAGSKESDKKHIMSRAKTLGAEDKLPDDWKGGEKDNMSKRLIKKFADFLKGQNHYIQAVDNDSEQQEGVQDFNTAYRNGPLGEEKDCELDKLVGALWTSIDSVVDDDTIADKIPLITATISQFTVALISNETINKSGKKISKDRMNALKDMHTKLGTLIQGAFDSADGLGDDNVAKSEFLKGHPTGCMCKDCVDKRASETAPVKKSADIPEEIQKRMDDIEKRNKELEEQVKKSADDVKVKDFIAKAANMSNLGVAASELGPILKSVSESVSKEGFDKIEAILKAANEKIEKGSLFSEKGADGVGETDIAKRVDGLAKDIQKRDGCTIEKARTLVYKENPALYQEHEKELWGAK